MVPSGAIGRERSPRTRRIGENPVDYAILLLLWLSFASATTLHVALAYVIGQRLGKLRGWLSLLGFPLAPYFGWLAGAKNWSLLWCVLSLAYVGLLLLASR
jgi:hypothetical protein